MKVVLKTWHQPERYRLSFNTFRWGVHIKLRTGRRWRHFIVKVGRGYAFGARRALYLWVTWWRSEKGQREAVSGLRATVSLIRRLQPSENMRIPTYPQRPRDRERAREVR